MALDESPEPSPRLEPRTVPQSQGWFRGAILRFAGVYAEVLLLSVLVNLLALAVPVFAIVAFDQLVPHFGQDMHLRLLVGMAVALGFGLVFKLLRDNLAVAAGSVAAAEIGDSLFQRVLAAKPGSGRDRVASVHSGELEELRAAFAATPVIAFVELPFVALFIAAAYAIGGPLAYFPFIATAAVLLISLILQFPMRSAIARIRDARRRRDLVEAEALIGLETVKGLGSEGEMQRRWDAAAKEVRQADRRANGYVAWIGNLTTVAGAFVIVCVIGFGAGRVAQADLSVGGLVAVAMLAAAAMAPLDRFTAALIVRQKGQVAREAIDAQMNVPVEREEGTVYTGLPDIAGSIVFQDVSFRYPDQKGFALDGVSFQIEPGEKVGLIGRMGAGKSAVIRLLMGLYEPEGGSVTIDGTDIRRIDPADLRSAIAWVPQEIRLFDGTLRDNLTMGIAGRDEDDIVRAARMVGVDEFAARHPEGFGMAVGPQGRYLSGGERQAVAVARALLRDAPVLLMDEPTSAFDNTSERRFRMRLSHVLGDRTLLLATNRASLLALVDRVIVIDGGRIVADGARHDVLEGLQGGFIRALREAS